MPPVQDQYKIGPEVMEIPDPTVEEEEADRIARSPPPLLAGNDWLKKICRNIMIFVLFMFQNNVLPQKKKKC